MHETLCHKIECSSIDSSLFRMNLILSYVKGTGFTGNFSLTLSIFLAHLSRRLTGELIGYPWIRRPSVVRSHFQTSSPLKPLCQSKPNFMWTLLGKGERNKCINGPGHMTKMAAMPIYGKNLKNLLLQNRRADFHETWYVASGTPAHHNLYK